MDSLNELTKSTSGKYGFLKHVFNFDDDSKAEMMNIIQYAVLAIIPVISLNKLMQKFVPEADDDKGSFEITAEIVAQIITMFLSTMLIHRMITFIPTYSDTKYADFSVTSIILAMLVIILSLQTKLGEKVSVLYDRVLDLWDGQVNKKQGAKGKGTVKVSQPISQSISQNQLAMNQSLNSMGSTSISSLPPVQNTQTQQMPDYNQMHQQDSTPLVGADSPGIESMEPMAANSGGMSSFGGAMGW